VRVDDFFRNHFEAHLLADMATLESVRLPAGANGGGVGYPLLATAIAATELLGALRSPTEFDPQAGRKRFTEWWQQELYQTSPERDIAPAVYSMVRNWVLHTFVGRDPFTVTTHGHANHLRAIKAPSGQSVEVFLDATQYAQDVRASYQRVIVPALSTPDVGLWNTLDARLKDVLAYHHKTWAADLATLNTLNAARAAPLSVGSATNVGSAPPAVRSALGLPVLHILTHHTKSVG
jgi:hypothetical protein